MDWILDHLQFIIAFAGVVAYWLNQRRREKAGEDADYDGDGIPENRPVRRQLDPNEPDPEEAERARRIQEEIRRKILERRGGTTQADEPPPLTVPSPARPAPRAPWSETPEAPRPVATGPLGEVLRRMMEQARDPEQEARAAAAERAVRERQRQLQEQLDALEEQRRAELTRASAFAESRSKYGDDLLAPARHEGRESSLVESLRDARNLRRAVILREVLGAPVALRSSHP